MDMTAIAELFNAAGVFCIVGLLIGIVLGILIYRLIRFFWMLNPKHFGPIQKYFGPIQMTVQATVDLDDESEESDAADPEDDGGFAALTTQEDEEWT